MKVLIACSVTPFSGSPGEVRARLLCEQLNAAGHASEILRLPFAADPPARLPAQLAMMRSFDTWNADHLLALDLPASLLRYPRKSAWLDSDWPFGAAAAASLQGVLRNATREALGESRRAYCTGQPAQAALEAALGIGLPVLAPPPLLLPDNPGHYVLAAPPRDPDDMRLLAALALAGKEVRLVLAGAPFAPGQVEALGAESQRLGVAQRVELDQQPLPPEAFGQRLSGAIAVICIGGADDAALALQAAGAGKALIGTAANTLSSGLLRHGLSGWTVDLAPAAIAACMDEAVTQRHRSLAYGAQARSLLHATGTSWTRTIQALLA